MSISSQGGRSPPANAPRIAGDEVEIPLADVPDAVLTAALDAMPGIELSETALEDTNAEAGAL